MLRTFLILYVTTAMGVGTCCWAATAAGITPTPTPATNGSVAPNGLTKRNIKVENISGKSYDPAPEYYSPRGQQGSSPSASSGFSYDHKDSRDRTTVAFPDKRYPAASSYNHNDRKHIQERTGLGHFVSTGSAGTTAYGGQYEPRYPSYPGGNSYSHDYSGYYGSTGYGGGHTAPGHDDGIPIDFYNKGYDAGDYGHSYTLSHGESPHHYPDKLHLAKSVLLPLAGAAALGLAAAFFVNPVLLQLGTVSGLGGGVGLGVGSGLGASFGRRRRRRRDLQRTVREDNAEQFSQLAYRGHQRIMQTV